MEAWAQGDRDESAVRMESGCEARRDPAMLGKVQSLGGGWKDCG